MLCALYLKIALYFLFDFPIVLKICCPVMTHYPSHWVLALYIFILHQVTFMWNTDGFHRKKTQHMNVNRSVQDSKQTCTQILLDYAIGTVPNFKFSLF